jgi:hypothetical protein
MRKVAFAFAAAALMLLAGALGAEATTGSGILGLRATAQHFSPVEAAGCRTVGPVCGLGRTWVCRPLPGLLVRPLLALAARTRKGEAAL